MVGLKSYYRTGLGICRIRMLLGNCGWDRTLELWGRDLESYIRYQIGKMYSM